MFRNKIHIVSFCLLLGLTSIGYKASAQQAEEDFSITSIDLYPNPATDYLIIELRDSQLEDVQFELRSMIGNQLIINPESIGLDKYRISVKEFASGYYFLVIRDDHTRFKKAFRFLKN